MTALSIPTPSALPATPLPSDLLGDTVVHEGLAEALNALLEATQERENRLPMALNAFGQWCTRDVFGSWQPHRSYMEAYRTAHAGQVA